MSSWVCQGQAGHTQVTKTLPKWPGFWLLGSWFPHPTSGPLTLKGSKQAEKDHKHRATQTVKGRPRPTLTACFPWARCGIHRWEPQEPGSWEPHILRLITSETKETKD